MNERRMLVIKLVGTSPGTRVPMLDSPGLVVPGPELLQTKTREIPKMSLETALSWYTSKEKIRATAEIDMQSALGRVSRSEDHLVAKACALLLRAYNEGMNRVPEIQAIAVGVLDEVRKQKPDLRSSLLLLASGVEITKSVISTVRPHLEAGRSNPNAQIAETCAEAITCIDYGGKITPIVMENIKKTIGLLQTANSN